MIPNPIHKVLSTLCTHDVRYLLMGGQACVLYGAAEFSRDCDIVIVCDAQNIERLQSALDALEAHPIAVPPFEADYLNRGHAIHFRCSAPEVSGLRIDVMSKLRGVASFEELWARRTTLEDDAGNRIETLALSDLVAAKKTQRDKDWPMLRRLLEAHYARHESSPSDERVHFWLRESRTPEILIELADRFPEMASRMATQRPSVAAAIAGNVEQLRQSLADEEFQQRQADRAYWEPLMRELEQLRRARRS